ncbi:putative Proteasome activator pa28 beta subunit [Monocercomonoides exilis]|uniref:putative Proteasome activator pa28 beta subunit n=1 Tax=Monocercomonoides exilis TaxID=2049356 RepID=UPI0035595125|nr:putative Proteasome activator pa28 beta subunit [Monocercomonoides exilis]|eukprot:MONOS_9711.1-p1 / transcript=MONOS_9711.1 / gene=MONOS_9711 / organism=Monocercomonoides_exilis_PA203 / gene_product=unspecified product / transcript_product=unspecified product / location=Mono_scaffold00411:26591-27663(+) / protein_length=299 / sequence_SO=supercontig / SO=protein_coding / is_pseudo=false
MLEQKKPRFIKVEEERVDSSTSEVKANPIPRDYGASLVSGIKDKLSEKVEHSLEFEFPQKIKEFQKYVEEVKSISLEDITAAAILPTKEEVSDDIKDRKKRIKQIKKEKRAELKKEAELSTSSEEKDDDNEHEYDFEDDIYLPAVFIPSKLKVPRNNALERLISIAILIKEEMTSLLLDLRTWLRLRIPSLLDGDNLGSDIVSAHIEAITYAIDCATGLLQLASTYRVARGKLIMQICSSPFNDDLRKAFVASDVDLYHNLMQLIPNTVNVLISTYDALGKNMEQIKAPRTVEQKQWLY